MVRVYDANEDRHVHKVWSVILLRTEGQKVLVSGPQIVCVSARTNLIPSSTSPDVKAKYNVCGFSSFTISIELDISHCFFPVFIFLSMGLVFKGQVISSTFFCRCYVFKLQIDRKSVV